MVSKLYFERFDKLVTTVDSCLSVKLPLIVLKKTLKFYLKKQNVKIDSLTDDSFELLLQRCKDYMLKVEREI